MQAEQWQKKTGGRMAIAAAVLLIGLLTWVFDGYLKGQQNPNRDIITTVAPGPVTLKRNRYGHYVATVLVNGQKVEALLDTGATYTSVSDQLARRLQLKRGQARTVNTANGQTTAFDTTIDSIQIGNIRQSAVRSSIVPAMGGLHVLIGMNFLKHLELHQEGDTLTLQTPPSL